MIDYKPNLYSSPPDVRPAGHMTLDTFNDARDQQSMQEGWDHG